MSAIWKSDANSFYRPTVYILINQNIVAFVSEIASGNGETFPQMARKEELRGKAGRKRRNGDGTNAPFV
jgi:hypothetical protein